MDNATLYTRFRRLCRKAHTHLQIMRLWNYADHSEHADQLLSIIFAECPLSVAAPEDGSPVKVHADGIPAECWGPAGLLPYRSVVLDSDRPGIAYIGCHLYQNGLFVLGREIAEDNPCRDSCADAWAKGGDYRGRLCGHMTY